MSSGPTLIFDKSFIQSLSVDEAVWLDMYFTCAIPPIFLTETIANLRKEFGGGRLPENEVRRIAEKTPQMGMPCVFHRDIAISNLHGNRIPLNGQIPVAGGRPATVGGRTGTQYDERPEAAAVARWSNGQFDEAEKLLADQWRRVLATARLGNPDELLARMGLSTTRCKTLDEAAAVAASAVGRGDRPYDVVGALVHVLDLDGRVGQEVARRWSTAGFPPLPQYAAYAAHVLRVETLVALAVRSSLESPDRASHVADVVYLYYLPFGLVFVSSDRIHRRLAPHLLVRAEQRFVWGPDLKADLKRINEHFLALPQDVRDRGIYSFGGNPPQLEDSVVAGLYDHFSPSWRAPREPRAEKPDEWTKELMAASKAGGLPQPDVPRDWNAEKGDFLMVQHRVRRKRGSWWQVPPDTPKDT